MRNEVEFANEEHHSVASVVKDYSVSEQTVRTWLKGIKEKADPYKQRVVELEIEIKDTKKKLADSATDTVCFRTSKGSSNTSSLTA